MSRREATLQQRDPLAAHAGRPVTLLMLAAAPLYAGAMAGFNHANIEYPALAVLSLLLTVAASVAFGIVSSPLRAPLTRIEFFAVAAIAFGAFLAQVLALGSANAFLRDDWAAICLGFIVLAASPYRPPAELAGIGAVAAVAVGIVTLGQLGAFATLAPASTFAVIAVLPVVALSLAATAFSATINASLDQWDRNTRAAVAELADEGSGWIARSVQQDRVTVLNQQVVPFFTGVLEAGTLSATDAERARELAESIRAIMVAGVDRSWLDTVVEQGGSSRGHTAAEGQPAVLDPSGRATEMSLEQRTAVRALLAAIFGEATVEPSSVRVSLDGERHRTEVVVVAALREAGSLSLAPLEPYVAVLRVLFDAPAADVVGSSLTVRFSYDHW